MGYAAMRGSAVLLVGLVVAAFAGAAVGAGSAARLVPAMYVLGDSTLDVGNNNHLPGKDVPRANVPFYGVDFPGGPVATGRFSNGYNVADFIGMYLPPARVIHVFCMFILGKQRSNNI
jgi:hypothetical protein